MSAIIGSRVRSRRLKLGLTQDRLAQLLGLKKAMVSRIERESRDTTALRLVKLCRILETTPNYLLGFSRRP